jgi:hypothetical protein
MCYEQLKIAYAIQLLQTPEEESFNTALPLHAYLICAGISGTIAAAVSNPIDRVKTMIQVREVPITQGSPLVHVVKEIVQKEGWWKAATRGVGSRCLWAVPNVVVSMTVFEALKSVK